MPNASEIAARLRVPLPVTVLDAVDSTNLEARRIADAGDLTPRVIIARRQTGGRGRLGRSFHSPAGGLYLSILLRTTGTDAGHLTTAAAGAVSRAVDRLTGRVSGIKWVNDIYLDGRKVCGILTEAKFAGASLAYAVVGIGVNVVAPEGGFPADIAGKAGALFAPGAAPSGAMSALAADIVNGVLALADAPASAYLDEYRAKSVVLGRAVDVARVHDDGAARRATALAIDDSLALVVRYEDGTVEAVSAGEVSLRL